MSLTVPKAHEDCSIQEMRDRLCDEGAVDANAAAKSLVGTI